MREKPKLLYIDDEPINLRLFELNFKKSFEVYTAESGLQGLGILHKTNGIAVVVSDMKMPGMSGTEFVAQARQLFPNVVFFILTGFDITDEIALALKEGHIRQYFRKPFNIKEMEEAISGVLF